MKSFVVGDSGDGGAWPRWKDGEAPRLRDTGRLATGEGRSSRRRGEPAAPRGDASRCEAAATQAPTALDAKPLGTSGALWRRRSACERGANRSRRAPRQAPARVQKTQHAASFCRVGVLRQSVAPARAGVSLRGVRGRRGRAASLRPLLLRPRRWPRT